MLNSQNTHSTTGNESYFVRPDRFDVSQESCFLQTPLGNFQILDYSAFGLAMMVPKEMTLEKEFEGTFFLYQKNLGTYTFHQTRSQSYQKDNLFNKIGLEALSLALPTERIDAIISVETLLLTLQKEHHSFEQIPQTIKNTIYRILENLQMLEFHLLTIEKKHTFYQLEEQIIFENELYLNLTEHFQSIFNVTSLPEEKDQIHLDLSTSESASTLQNLNPEKIEQIGKFFKLTLMPLFQQTPLLSNTENPLNFIGQMETMAPLERSALLGKTLFGKALSHFFLNHPLALAIKDRAYYLFYQFLDFIPTQSPTPIRILALETGPALELQMLLKHFAPTDITLDIMLLDTQVSSLKKTQKKLKELSLNAQKNPSLKFQQLQLSPHFLSSFFKSKPHTFDLIYSTSLMDILRDQELIYCMEQCLIGLKPTGKAIFGTFDTNTTQQLLLQLAFNPHLQYRSSKQLQALFSTIPHTITQIEQEPGSVNCFSTLTPTNTAQ